MNVRFNLGLAGSGARAARWLRDLARVFCIKYFAP